MTQLKLENPLDTLFDVDTSDREDQEYGELVTATPGAVTTAPVEKDAEDVATDGRFDAVYDAAMETFQNQTAYTEMIEPRYAARNYEVAASFLNIALQAAATKARVKTDRKRSTQFIPNAGGKTVNNTIVATREEIIRMISVDAQTKELK